jgi:hypothetical protein
MSLTREQITAGATYTVRLEVGELSHKRFADAKALVKRIGEREDHAARYNAGARAWTVTLPGDSVNGLRDLQNLAHAYSADVEHATEDTTPAPAGRRTPAPRTSAWERAAGLAEREDGDGYTRSERDAMGH